MTRDGPVAVLLKGKGRPAGVAHLDDIARYREVVEPFGVVGVEIQAAVAGVGIALSPHRGIELVHVDAVDADAGGVVDGFAIAEAGVFGKPEGGRVHDDGVALTYDSLWVHAKRHDDLAGIMAYWRARMHKELMNAIGG